MDIEEFLGKRYVLVTHENFEEYLLFLDLKVGAKIISYDYVNCVRTTNTHWLGTDFKICEFQSWKGYLARKAALSMRPEHTLTANDDGSYTFSLMSTLVNSTIRFTPGEEFVEERPDGSKVKSVITIEANKIIHIQTEDDGKVSTHVREFFPDKLMVTTTADGINKVVKRHFKLVQ